MTPKWTHICAHTLLLLALPGLAANETNYVNLTGGRDAGRADSQDTIRIKNGGWDFYVRGDGNGSDSNGGGAGATRSVRCSMPWIRCRWARPA